MTGVLFGSNRLNFPLAALAFIILLGSLSMLVYNTVSEESTDTVTVNGKDYGWDELFEDFEETQMEDKNGIVLSDIVNDTGLQDPDSHEYKVVGADGYAKTVSWDDLMNGILIKETKEVFFPNLPKQFYVSNIVEIEVK